MSNNWHDKALELQKKADYTGAMHFFGSALSLAMNMEPLKFRCLSTGAALCAIEEERYFKAVSFIKKSFQKCSTIDKVLFK